MDDIESLCRGFLQNAASRQGAIAQAAPEAPTADYLAGYGDGWDAGHVAAFALVVTMMSGDSMTGLIEEAGTRAAVEAAFPFDMIMVEADGAADSGTASPRAA